ncbi:hypothetical protein PISMIDRAFT_685438 [Pisolithus microcarpus 441]|uniref:Uncharacterized protein n=1 Tax=Pisolithus microcarpus 441 TaxID=765257 RepID=A0A0C9YKP5_9AGAM|nr:hypothetical protein BKA83DRAFT_685438 [Pisolithus microcarpus]KIK17251.1 hypothetical protein PISMIDRAFT_685438 [Pisolithus microcarpus 441]
MELQPNTFSIPQQASGGSSSRLSERVVLVGVRSTMRVAEFALGHSDSCPLFPEIRQTSR